MLRKFGPFCGALLVFLVIFLLAENYAAPSFQSCVSQNAETQSTEEPKNKSRIIGRLIFTESVCSLRLVDRHNGFFAAIAAFVIAAFTFTLWQSTEKLWRASEDQLEHAKNEAMSAAMKRLKEEARLQEQINIAGQSANAAKQAADAAIAAERAQMFVIIQGEYLDMLTEGARRYPNTPSMDDGLVSSAGDVSFNFKNYGKTPAIIKEICARLVYGEKPPNDPVYIPSDQILREHMIASGEVTQVIRFQDEAVPHRCKLESQITLGQAKTIVMAQNYLWFYGRVVYDDIFGQEHEHRFIWRYGGAHGFRPNYEHPNYIKNT